LYKRLQEIQSQIEYYKKIKREVFPEARGIIEQKIDKLISEINDYYNLVEKAFEKKNAEKTDLQP
jgi:hypothetical protein